jgi:hypothetical protein
VADVRCPMCGKPNPKELDVCQYCGARLKPILASPPPDSRPIKPGEEPVKRATSNLDNVKYGGGDSIRPGDVPTKKNTSELERALPSWLRSLREMDRPAAGEHLAEPSSDEEKPIPALPARVPEPSGGMPDWLRSVGETPPEKEEVPDWLAGLRDDKPSGSTSRAEEEPAPELGSEDWMSRLGGEPKDDQHTPITTKALSESERSAFEAAPGPAPARDLPDWIKPSQPAAPDLRAALFGTEPEAAPAEDLPDWIKPSKSALPAQPESQPGPQAKAAPAEELPDWIKPAQPPAPDLRAALFGSEPAAPAESLPDWINPPQSAAPVPPQPTFGLEPEAAPAEDVPDWARSLRPSEPEAFPAENIPDWMKPLRPAAPDLQETLPASEPEAVPADDLPDWAKSLRPSEPDQPGTLAGSEPEALPAENIPDWMKPLRPAAMPEPQESFPASEPEAVPAEDLPDWAKPLRPSEPDQSGALSSSGPEAVPAEGLPDWIKPPPSAIPDQPDQRFEPAPGNTPEEKLLDQVKPPLSTAPLPPEPMETQPGDENLPDWLAGLPDLSAESAPKAEEALPDWMDALNQKSIPQEVEQPSAGAGPLPDWLANFETPPSTPSASETPLPAAQEGLPNWLSHLETNPGVESGTPVAFLGSGLQDEKKSPLEKPDWLSQLQAGADSMAGVTGQSQAAPEPPAPPAASEPVPDWLAGIERTSAPSTSVPALLGDGTALPVGGQGQTAFPMETPEWLSKVKPVPGGEKAAESKPEQPDSTGLEAAQLPTWVKALRPVEAVVESKTAAVEQNLVTERSGPLAGLRGVLPAVPGMVRQRKPPAYTNKLQISDEQQRYARILDRLVAGETQPRLVKPALLTSNQLWRWVVTLLLILAVGLPVISGVKIAPATALSASDKGATAGIIAGLSAEKPILLAFDYDPALSGELEAVAAPIMDQVLGKGIPLALVSTSPTGPALAEHFLNTTTLVNVHQYKRGEQYINLGYLAGGPAGMLYFADSPAQAAPVDVDGYSVWGSGFLQGIRSLKDFAAVIVLTDNADTGRNWIEQAGPRLGKTPLLMLISAQAEPMVRPYFDSGQLAGLVSGLSDAKVFEQNYTRPGLANQYWNSYSLGMLVAELLIAVGAVLGVTLDWRTRQKGAQKEA